VTPVSGHNSGDAKVLGNIFLAARANADIGETFAFLLFPLHMMNQRLARDIGARCAVLHSPRP
jgi:hypothetical protein